LEVHVDDVVRKNVPLDVFEEDHLGSIAQLQVHQDVGPVSFQKRTKV
jgi:hypothetical protein